MDSDTRYAKRLLVIQPYIPEYRVPFFRVLRHELASIGVQVAVAAARAGAGAELRADDFTLTSGDFLLDERSIHLGRRTVLYRNLGAALAEFDPDLIVVEQAVKNLESWPLIMSSRLHPRRRVAMWGQGRSYSTGQSGIEAATKQWLTRRCDWFFAYTEGGAAHVVERGFPAARVTVLQNSTDTVALRRDVTAVTESDLAAFRARNALTPGRVGLFIGGVDERKGIGFLLETAKAIEAQLPGFRLLVAGAGSMAGAVSRLEREGGPVVYLSRVSGAEKALALAAADVVLIPEWVGLAVVDALAAGIPIITTRHSSHSPEVEYLVEGQTAVFAQHDVADYSRTVARVLLDPEECLRMSLAARRVGDAFSVERMAHNFAQGVVAWSES